MIVGGSRDLRSRVSACLAESEISVLARVEQPEKVIALCQGDSDLLVIVCCDADDALALVRPLKRATPETRIIVLADAGDAPRALRATLRSQVEAVVYRTRLDQALVPAVMAVFAQLVVFPRTDRRSMEPPALSYRERQVLRLAVHGRTNDQIGRELFLATSTVKSHLTSAFAKLDVRSRSEAATVLLDPEHPLGGAILNDELWAVNGR